MCLEVLVITPAIRNLIREDKLHQIYSQMQTGGKFGMQTMNQSLFSLLQRKQITVDEAINRSTDVDELKSMLSGHGVGTRPHSS
jgi:twitching motility protein PilT